MQILDISSSSSMVWVKIPQDLTWCKQGLVNFYQDYPEPIEPSRNGLVDGIRLMRQRFRDREHRQASAMADMAYQRMLYEEEQSFFRCALYLLLKPREFLQGPLTGCEAYIHACLYKVLVEQSIYNNSPFLTQASMVHNEYMLQINGIGFGHAAVTAAVTAAVAVAADRFGRPGRFNGPPLIFPVPHNPGQAFGGDGPSSVELAMARDQQEFMQGLRRRRRRFDGRQLHAGYTIDHAGFDDAGRPLLRTRLSTDEIGPDIPPAAMHDRSYVHVQQTRRVVHETTGWIQY